MAFRLVMGIAKQEGIISAENSNSCKKHTIKNNDRENEGFKTVKIKAKIKGSKKNCKRKAYLMIVTFWTHDFNFFLGFL